MEAILGSEFLIGQRYDVEAIMEKSFRGAQSDEIIKQQCKFIAVHIHAKYNTLHPLKA